MKILIIEDEDALLESMAGYLRKEGYVCETATDFASAGMKTGVYEYDCLVVDITLPGGNGLDIIREIKKTRPETGVIIVSAKNSLDDKVTGLGLGADDYLTKPFHLSELNARVKSILRRRQFGGASEVVFRELSIEPESRKVTVKKKPVELTKKEFDLLSYFVANTDKVVTREAIAEHLWGDNMDMADNFDFVYTHIKNLRKKLTDTGAQDYIRTVYGLGYKFAAA